ncbi:MAG: DUF2125 domain-containing protein [Janthinobacterium lividum]
MQPLPRHRSTRRLRVFLAALLVSASMLVGIDTLMWFRLEHLLDQRLDRFSTSARTSGWRFGARAGERGGWPLSATLTLVRPLLHGTNPLAPAGIDWSGERVILSLSPLHPHRLVITAAGTQSLSLMRGGEPPIVLRFWGARIALHMPPDADPAHIAHYLLDAEALHVALPGAGPDDITQLAEATGRLEWQPPNPAPDDDASAAERHDAYASISLDLRDVALPARLRASGRVVQRATLRMVLTGDPVATRLPTVGRLHLAEASLDWGDSAAAMAGDASLDVEGRTNGSFDLALTRPDPALRQMGETGLIGPGTSTMLRGVIGLIAVSQQGPQVHLPLTLRDGLLSLGQIPLLQIDQDLFGTGMSWQRHQ